MCQEVVDSMNQCERMRIQKYIKTTCWAVRSMNVSKQVVFMDVIMPCVFLLCVRCACECYTCKLCFCVCLIHSSTAKPTCVCERMHLSVYSVKCIPHVGAAHFLWSPLMRAATTAEWDSVHPTHLCGCPGSKVLLLMQEVVAYYQRLEHVYKCVQYCGVM